MDIVQLKVKGMSCSHCVKSIEGSIGTLPGVEKVVVNLTTRYVAFDNNSSIVSLNKIKETNENQEFYLG